jgi:hypothetical protein
MTSTSAPFSTIQSRPVMPQSRKAMIDIASDLLGTQQADLQAHHRPPQGDTSGWAKRH